MTPEPRGRADWLAPLGTVLAFFACYGTLAAVSALSLIGINVAIHEGIWAGVIALFALLAFAGIVLGWLRHRSLLPLLLGLAGTVLVLWAMGASYNRSVEIAGFIFLVLGAAFDWQARRKPPPRANAA